MMAARRGSSTKLYDTYLSRWKVFCASNRLHFLKPTISQALGFLQSLLQSGLGYSALNTARSALSAILLIPGVQSFGNHPDVVLFMKGAFNLKPTRPRYTSTWDSSVVLQFLERWAPASDISLEKLTMKLMVLILLITGQRPQLLTKLNLANMKESSDAFEFILEITDYKQGRVNYRPGAIILKQYPTNKKLCAFHYLKVYIQRTALLRHGYTLLFLTHKKPHRPVSQNSVTRWIKTVLQLAGIDITTFTAGSVRLASTSKAK
jgi:integrase